MGEGRERITDVLLEAGIVESVVDSGGGIGLRYTSYGVEVQRNPREYARVRAAALLRIEGLAQLRSQAV